MADEATLQVENLSLTESGPSGPTLRKRVPIKTLMAQFQTYIGQTVGIGGWVRTCRKGGAGKFAFIHIYDGTCGVDLQIIVDSAVPGFEGVTKENGIGCCIFAIGTIVASVGKEQAVEMKATEIQVLGACDPVKYPLAGKAHSLEYLRTIQHFRPRTMVLGAVMRIRNALAFGTHTFFQEQGFQYIHTPLITASDCEGGGEMFQVTTLIKDDEFTHKLPNGKADSSKDFFKRPAYLTVSGQLNAEIYATAMSSVYTFGPTFRAEDSHTSRHLSEFWMIEPEISFADLYEDMEIAESFLKFVIKFAMDKCPEDFETLENFEVRHLEERKKEEEKEAKAQKFRDAERMKELKAKGELPPQEKKEKKEKKKEGETASPAPHWRSLPLRQRLQSIISSEFARIPYTDVITKLQQIVADGHKFEESKIEWGMDLASEHERYMCEVVFKRPTIVYNYPKDIKAFYMRMNEDNKTVRAMDILVPGVGEIIGGSQREERADKLLARIREMGLKEEDYSWYMDLRHFGTVPHSGFGAGFERLVCYSTGIDNIRDVIPFPRYPGHADF